MFPTDQVGCSVDQTSPLRPEPRAVSKGMKKALILTQFNYDVREGLYIQTLKIRLCPLLYCLHMFCARILGRNNRDCYTRNSCSTKCDLGGKSCAKSIVTRKWQTCQAF